MLGSKPPRANPLLLPGANMPQSERLSSSGNARPAQPCRSVVSVLAAWEGGRLGTSQLGNQDSEPRSILICVSSILLRFLPHSPPSPHSPPCSVGRRYLVGAGLAAAVGALRALPEAAAARSTGAWQCRCKWTFVRLTLAPYHDAYVCRLYRIVSQRLPYGPMRARQCDSCGSACESIRARQ